MHYTVYGTGGNIPTCDAYLSPAIEETNCIAVFDDAISTFWEDVIVCKPIRVVFRNGFAEKIIGDTESKMFHKSILLLEKNKELERSGKYERNKAERFIQKLTQIPLASQLLPVPGPRL